MDERTCSIDECQKLAEVRGMCDMHYRRTLRKGTPYRRPKVKDTPCSVPDCERLCHVTGYCSMHAKRLRATGTVEKRVPTYRDYTIHGYVLLRLAPGSHPLANGLRITSDGRMSVFEHRVVLYDAIGPGTHPCAWCQRPVSWDISVRLPGGLTVDHLNWDRSDNRLSNLVPSCLGCNKNRSQTRAS